jgi:hypothetical protein
VERIEVHETDNSSAMAPLIAHKIRSWQRFRHLGIFRIGAEGMLPFVRNVQQIDLIKPNVFKMETFESSVQGESIGFTQSVGEAIARQFCPAQSVIINELQKTKQAIDGFRIAIFDLIAEGNADQSNSIPRYGVYGRNPLHLPEATEGAGLNCSPRLG